MTATSLNVKISALVDVDPTHALPNFNHHAREIGFHTSVDRARVTVHLIGGDLIVEEAESGTSLTIYAPDQVMLQMLRDYVTYQVSLHGLQPQWEGHRAEGQPDSHAKARVVSSVQISPSYRRVTLVGRDLMRFDEGGLHFRVLVRPEGLNWPTADSNGVTQWPGGIAAWHRPIYTTRALRKGAEVAELDFDVVVHEGGRMTDWSANVKPGEEVVLVGPAGNRTAISADWQGFVGDETAVPGIIGQIEMMSPNARGEAILVVRTAEDVQSFKHPEGVTITWLLRDDDQSPLGALKSLQIPNQNRSVFFVASGKEVEKARQYLLEKGLAKREFVTVAYWGKVKS